MLRMFLNTGLRRGELFNLSWDDIDFTTKQIQIRETKTARGRYIPMNKLVSNELMRLYSSRSEDGIVYKSPKTGKKFVDIKKAFSSACHKAGITNLRIHDLRRTFATRLLNAGADIVTVQHLLGHRNVSTTMIYTMTNREEKHSAVSLLDDQERDNLAHSWHTEQRNRFPYDRQNVLISWN
jgi:integrase